MRICGHVLAVVDLWRSEDSFVESFPSFHLHVDPTVQNGEWSGLYRSVHLP